MIQVHSSAWLHCHIALPIALTTCSHSSRFFLCVAKGKADAMIRLNSTPLQFQALAICSMIAFATMIFNDKPGDAHPLLLPLIWFSIAATLVFIIDRLIVYPYMRSTLRRSFPTIFVRLPGKRFGKLALTPKHRTTRYGVSPKS